MTVEDRIRLIELYLIQLVKFVRFSDLPEEVRNYIELIEKQNELE